MADFRTTPRVLIVTPEVTYLPKSMGSNSNNLNAKAGGLADVSAALISELYRQGADVHVALPDYRSISILLKASFLKLKIGALTPLRSGRIFFLNIFLPTMRTPETQFQ